MTTELKKLVADVLERHESAGFVTVADVCVVCKQPYPCDAVQLAKAVQVLAEALERISMDEFAFRVHGNVRGMADAALAAAAKETQGE